MLPPAVFTPSAREGTELFCRGFAALDDDWVLVAEHRRRGRMAPGSAGALTATMLMPYGRDDGLKGLTGSKFDYYITCCYVYGSIRPALGDTVLLMCPGPVGCLTSPTRAKPA